MKISQKIILSIFITAGFMSSGRAMQPDGYEMVSLEDSNGEQEQPSIYQYLLKADIAVFDTVLKSLKNPQQKSLFISIDGEVSVITDKSQALAVSMNIQSHENAYLIDLCNDHGLRQIFCYAAIERGHANFVTEIIQRKWWTTKMFHACVHTGNKEIMIQFFKENNIVRAIGFNDLIKALKWCLSDNRYDFALFILSNPCVKLYFEQSLVSLEDFLKECKNFDKIEHLVKEIEGKQECCTLF